MSNAARVSTTPKRNFFSGVGCWGSFAIIATSLLFYLIACAAPTMVFDKETWLGIQALVLGWQGVFLGQFAWFANGFYFLSLILVFFRLWIVSLPLAGLATLIAFDAFRFIGAQVPLDEAFVNSMVFRSYHIGFYFWLASILVVGIGAVVMLVVNQAVKTRSVKVS